MGSPPPTGRRRCNQAGRRAASSWGDERPAAAPTPTGAPAVPLPGRRAPTPGRRERAPDRTADGHGPPNHPPLPAPRRISRDHPASQSPSILDRWEPYLFERWRAGCHNALQLYREIHEQGYTGSCPLVSRWTARYRKEHPDMSKAVATATPEPPVTEVKPPMRRLSPSQAAWLLVQQPADLTEDEHTALDKLQKAVADIATAYTLAQDFIRMVRERTADALTDWIARAAASSIAELGSFASGLQRDRRQSPWGCHCPGATAKWKVRSTGSS